ncbi:MAG: hypothetical protein IKU03_06340 [Bacteroidales bacterium]|nr:hypothetical protein [Bacteroidales bacterium]
MRKTCLYLALLLALFGISCTSTPEEKLLKSLKPLAKEYLKENKIPYDSLRVDCVDTITELSYANLNIELLSNMENNYQMQYEEAMIDDTVKANYLRLYLGDIRRTIEDFQDLMESGNLDSKKVLLYLVTGTVFNGEESEYFMFLVKPDKKTLHTMDPFGDNLLYQDE